MNPIVLYPQNATQVKFFRETAEKKGIKMTRISKKALEDIEDDLLGARMHELSKTAKPVSREQVMATFDRIINGK